MEGKQSPPPGIAKSAGGTSVPPGMVAPGTMPAADVHARSSTRHGHGTTWYGNAWRRHGHATSWYGHGTSWYGHATSWHEHATSWYGNERTNSRDAECPCCC